MDFYEETGGDVTMQEFFDSSMQTLESDEMVSNDMPQVFEAELYGAIPNSEIPILQENGTIESLTDTQATLEDMPEIPEIEEVEPYESIPNSEIPILQENGTIESLADTQAALEDMPEIPEVEEVEPYEAIPNSDIPVLQEDGTIDSLEDTQAALDAMPEMPEVEEVEPYESIPNSEIPILQEDGTIESLADTQAALETMPEMPEVEEVEPNESTPNSEIPILQEDGDVVSLEDIQAVSDDMLETQESETDELSPNVTMDAIADGMDDPSTCEYFEDGERAAEILTEFKPDNWEQLSLDEQKEAIRMLADYNADILGIQNKPHIEYYNLASDGDYGGYCEATNTIRINEYNMHDALETADTISHEYRHNYQHQRAMQPANDRDRQYGINYENYVSPDTDFRAYRNQIVEADARAYAERFQQYINRI